MYWQNKHFKLILTAYILIQGLFPGTADGINKKQIKIDSLENLLTNHHTIDTTKVNLLNKLTYKLYSSNKKKALSYSLEAVDIAQKLYFTRGLTSSYRLTGICYAYQANYPLAVEYYEKAIELSLQTNNQKELGLALNGMGNYYRNQGEFKLAQNHYNKAIEAFNAINYKEGCSLCYNNIGLIYIRQANYSAALDYMHKSLQINEGLKNDKRISICLNNIGLIHHKQKEYNKALKFFTKALDINRKWSNQRGIYIRLNNIGAIYSDQKMYDKALEKYNEALLISSQLNDKRGQSKSLNHIGLSYLKLKQNSKAIEYFQKAMRLKTELNEKQGISLTHYYLGAAYLKKNRLDKALEHTNKSLSIAKKLSLIDIQKDAYLQLSKIHNQLNHFEKALSAHIKHKNLFDSIFNEKNIRAIANLESQYEYEKEKHLIEANQQRNAIIHAKEVESQKRVRNSFIFGFVFMLLLAVVSFRSFMLKRKTNKELAFQKNEIANQANELQESNEKLKELDRFKQDLTNMIIHDLKAPLSSIINVKQMNNEAGLNLVQYSGYKMLNLIQNILGVYKYQDTIMQLTKTECQLLHVIQSAMLEVKLMADSKRVAINHRSISNGIIEADKELLVRVFVNLLSNAIKYSPENSTVRITTDTLKVGYLSIHIINSGPHIPLDEQSRIFERFNQAERKTCGNIESTGLGLTFCKLAIESHGGEINVTSAPNTEVDFWFTLPVKNKPKTGIQSLLSNNDKVYLSQFTVKLSSLETFEISKINTILNQIEPKSLEIEQWKKDLTQAVYSNNQKQYNQMLKTITNNNR